MAKLEKRDEPTKELPVELHENLVRQTLKINPNLAPNMDAKAFIQEQSGIFAAVKPAALVDTKDKKPSVAVRTLNSFFAQERKKHQKLVADINKKKLTLDKEAATARRLTATTLVRYLATNLKNTDDLKEVLAQNRVFLQELAVSEKDLIVRTTELMRKLHK